MAREFLENTREEIQHELDRMADELRDHVTDQNDGYDDHTPNIPRALRKGRALENRLKAFDKYGVNSMDALQADPLFQRDNLLFRAMHSFQRAAVRWKERRYTGLTDRELMDAFDEEAGRGYSGYSGDEGWYDCRPGRFTWKDNTFADQVLTGSALVRLLRELLHIPEPAGQENAPVEQLNLFHEP